MVDSELVRKLIRLALEEDRFAEDVTATLTVPPSARCRAQIIAREVLVIAGLDVIPLIVAESGSADGVTVEINARDGDEALPGTRLATMHGATRTVLSLERTILNMLQRSCGVATWTRSFVTAAGGMKVLDTRKTMPGWRTLDKYAARIGGAVNHRMNLSDMILVKNNHVDARGEGDALQGLDALLSRIAHEKPSGIGCEVEVRNVAELEVVLGHARAHAREPQPFPSMIMLDNWNDEEIAAAVARIRESERRIFIEASGNMTAERARRLLGSGLDAVSVGALTTKAPNVDISMKIERAVP